jgi:hypothetical protein
MITRLGVQNFKRFLDLSLPLRPLTVLTGAQPSERDSAPPTHLARVRRRAVSGSLTGPIKIHDQAVTPYERNT